MEVLHTAYILKADINFEDADLEDTEKRNTYAQKTPTSTLPFLETPNGNIAESNSIEYFLINKYNPELLGKTNFEKAKINQWIQFCSCEIKKCLQEIIFPIFNWREVNKELAGRADKNLDKYLSTLEKELNHGNKYLLGKKITLADIVLFRYLRFFMMLHMVEERRNKFPKLSKWFTNIMNSPEAVEAYGRTVLCKRQIKPQNIKIDRAQKIENYKKICKIKKEENPLDLLPPSSFDLNEFRKKMTMSKGGNKDKIVDKFWKEFDPKGYSLWFMEYQNLESEGKKLFRMNNSKNFFLERIDEDFKNYAFGVHGVYGNEGDYKVRGVWLWRGNEIPKEIKDNEYYEYMTIRKLKHEDNNDRALVKDFWTQLQKGDKVDGRALAEFSYY